jgi:glycosyltransferase involved in cell wall biosynthesis
LVSWVAPAYNERENLAQLVDEIHAAAERIDRPWELIVVDDASDDGSAELLDRLRADRPAMRVLRQRRRAGKAAALEAGFKAARGAHIVILDADLQNDPADVPAMLAKVASGECDFVNGWRRDRNDPWIRLVSTRIGNGVRNRLTRESIRDSACGLKVFRREVTESFKMYEGLHRFLPTLAKMGGFAVEEVVVSHRPRVAGVAKFGVWNRLFNGLRDAFAVRWMQNRNLRYETKELD